MAKIDLPSYLVRGLFYALRNVRGVLRRPIRHRSHYGQRRSVFERLGPRVRRNNGNGRLFESAVCGLRANVVPCRQWTPVRGRLASPPRDPLLQGQPPSPHLGLDGVGPSNVKPSAVEAPAPPIVDTLAPRRRNVAARVHIDPAHTRVRLLAADAHTSRSNSCSDKKQCTSPDPWFLNTRAAPALDAMEVEEGDAVSSPSINNSAARTGASA
ncbi:hypothetical protein SETIT_9G410300v2 [Setaria italica]|uniref:Uncharacterized protein n=1 Tax=Setaria italica TaxID=4555 RepID=A0A368ST16_SETIT|nr:hypothetical protein SETIT_9G410300v2 [Setaria italica]